MTRVVRRGRRRRLQRALKRAAVAASFGAAGRALRAAAHARSFDWATHCSRNGHPPPLAAARVRIRDGSASAYGRVGLESPSIVSECRRRRRRRVPIPGAMGRRIQRSRHDAARRRATPGRSPTSPPPKSAGAHSPSNGSQDPTISARRRQATHHSRRSPTSPPPKAAGGTSLRSRSDQRVVVAPCLSARRCGGELWCCGRGATHPARSDPPSLGVMPRETRRDIARNQLAACLSARRCGGELWCCGQGVHARPSAIPPKQTTPALAHRGGLGLEATRVDHSFTMASSTRREAFFEDFGASGPNDE